MINSFVGPWGIKADYGWFHVYAFTMLFGMVVAIFASWYKLWRYKIPSDGLALSVIFIIPISLFGASWIGKTDPYNPLGFWEKFAFWKPGMSIHGGVLFGLIVGLIFFAIFKKKTKISLFVYGDCIIPNVLLGQVIGRWGNFYNHELLGQIVGYSATLNGSGIAAINWLPAFIRDNSFQLFSGVPETGLNPVTNQIEYVFRAPIFLYESLANLGFWVILTFVLPKAFRWFSKKPWKIASEKYKLLTFNNIINERKTKTTKLVSNKQETFNNQAMFLFAENQATSFRQKFLFFIKNPFKLLNLSISLIYQNQKLKRKYWKSDFYNYQADQFIVKNLSEKYKIKKTEVLTNNDYKRITKSYLISKAYCARSKELYYLNNPRNYLVMRSGVQMWLYFFGWNLIRFAIELQRPDEHLFLINRRALDYTLLILFFTVTFILASLSQWVFAKYNRNSDWTYEKQY